MRSIFLKFILSGNFYPLVMHYNIWLTSCQQQKEVTRSQLTPTLLSDSILTTMPGDLLLADNHIVWSDPFGKEVFLHVHDMDGKEIGSMGKIKFVLRSRTGLMSDIP